MHALPWPAIGLIWTDGSPGVAAKDWKMAAIESMTPLSRPLLLVAGLGALTLAATLGLWGYYGTTVFFEMVRTGWVTCF